MRLVVACELGALLPQAGRAGVVLCAGGAGGVPAVSSTLSMSSRRRSRPGTPAEFNAPSTGRRTPLGALQQNNSGTLVSVPLEQHAATLASQILS